MSIHPNAILMVAFTPDDLSRKTYRNILEYCNVKKDGYIKICENDYKHLVMEDYYDTNNQISAKEGDIVIFDMVTYGYGEVISWNILLKQKQELEKFAIEICEKFNCSFEIFVTSNYW